MTPLWTFQESLKILSHRSLAFEQLKNLCQPYVMFEQSEYVINQAYNENSELEP